MLAFIPSQSLSHCHLTNSIVSTDPARNNKPNAQQLRHLTPTCQTPHPSKKLTRRLAISIIAASTLAPILTNAVQPEPYDVNKSRRYVPQGRPAPDRPVPKFQPDKTIFNIDDRLSAQDIKTGDGETIARGSLVLARWRAVLADGTTVDDSNENQPALFRPGAHQVPPGIEDAVLGMQAGGIRRVSGSSERILSNIAVGYDIGERSLVPNDSTIYIDIFVDRVNPFGKSR